ncbi:MAG TPA: peptidylprolyl isomerase [Roseiflexaceae bacterium]|nr:peptidylprolyl isomerase [Roseiflexaceae bacterium]
MTQRSRPPKARPTPPPNRAPAVLSALSVVVIFVVLGFVLLSNRSTATPAGAQPTVPAFADATANAETNTNASTNAAPTTASEAAPSGTAVGLADSSGAAAKKTYSAPPMTIDPTKNYTATITTANGDIVIKLRPDLAPKTVNSFVFLAREGFYDGLTFHRVIPGFVAQGGDPKGDGSGGPGYTVPGEFTDKVPFDKPGIVAMARPGNDVNGNGSQFFITLAPAPNLNGQYTIFGEVIKGQDVVDKITPRDPQQATTPGDKIEKITIQEG